MSNLQRSKNLAGNSERNFTKNSEKNSAKSHGKNFPKNPTKISGKNIKRNVERSSESASRRNFEKDSDFVPFDDNLAKDFGFLVNAPVSEDDGFVFKFEKSWSYDAPSFSEFFVLDLKKLSLALNATAFNEIVNIDQKYLTSDQIASLSNEASKFGVEFENLLKENAENVADERSKGKDEFESSIDEETEELDFLLSLKKPQPSNALPRTPIATTYSGTKAKTQSRTTDAHKWLDFIFDDSAASGDLCYLEMLDE